MVIKLGVIGISEGNGHPFSFSTIINGYSKQDLYFSGWDVIYDYVTKKDASEFGFEEVQVTDAWTQDIKSTKQLCKACLISNAHEHYEDMIGKVDAIMIARDDYQNHLAMAEPFLKTGHYVFVDKPLSLDIKQLKKLQRYLKNGQLMSCSGMRYALELDDLRNNISDLGEIMLINGVAPKSWEKYGIHLLEATLPIIPSNPVSVTVNKANHSSMAITTDSGALIYINSLGKVIHPFTLEFIGSKKVIKVEIKDNFTMFRRMLWHYIQQIKTKKPAIPPETTLTLMKVLIAGQMAMKEKRTVYLDEIVI